MEVTLTYESGEEVSHRIIPVDLVAFERHYATGWEEVQESPKVEHVLFLAWNSAKRSQQTALSFDDWMATVVDIESGEAEGGAPLQPSSDSSQPSQ